MKKLVVLSGAGVSAESGIKTFRDANGLWENHSIDEVATPEGFAKNPALVLRFYNERRAQAVAVKPNEGHFGLVELEKDFDVTIITQNVDNLHERAGSSKVIHLHGELTKVRSSADPTLIFDIGGEAIQVGDLCSLGSQLRPHIVWFGEMVPLIETAAAIAYEADIFVVVGTSMQVYPAAGLISYVEKNAPKFVIDPNTPDLSGAFRNLTVIQEPATVGVKILREKLKRL